MGRAEELFAAWMSEVGLAADPELQSTPERFTALMREYSGAGPAPDVSVFPCERTGPVVLRALPFHSLCAHHLLPFFGTATIAYLPETRIVGFSSVAQVLQHHARRPQVQERLAREVCDHLFDAFGPKALLVRLRARQLCMEMRGAQSGGEVDVFAERGEGAQQLLGIL